MVYDKHCNIGRLGVGGRTEMVLNLTERNALNVEPGTIVIVLEDDTNSIVTEDGSCVVESVHRTYFLSKEKLWVELVTGDDFITDFLRTQMMIEQYKLQTSTSRIDEHAA